MKKAVLQIMSFIFAVLFMTSTAYAAIPLDYPHTTTNGIYCDDCHYPGATDFLDPAWKHDPPASIDDTPFNNFCWSCHSDGENAPAQYVDTHSSFSTGSRFSDWSVECRTCHWPHHIMQYRTYGPESYIDSGQSTAVNNNSLSLNGAGWTEDEFAGMILIPNTESNNYNYKITGNTGDTIYISGSIDPDEASAGDSFAVVYNNIVQSSIDLGNINVTPPKSGIKEVKFFNSTGTNSFADGDTVYNGVCEVCHTITNHFRNDGTGVDPLHENMDYPAGTDCTRCHMHKNGFRGMGGGAHDTHVARENGPLYGPGLDCTACHDMSNIPYFKSGTDTNGDGQYDLSETGVCDGCHSLDAVDTAKNYWNTSGSSENNPESWRVVEGDESYCGSCHDDTPGSIGETTAPNIAGDGENYGFFVTGHGRPYEDGNYNRLSWQEDGAEGNPPAMRGCSDCHDLLSIHIDDENNTGRLKPGFENDEDNSNCNQCHTESGGFVTANAEPFFYTNYDDYDASAHTERKCTDCHDVHGLGGHTAMTLADRQDLCFQCHTEGVVQNDAISNNRPGGHNSADDIEEAFGKPEKHNLGTAFNIEGRDYTLECVSCHNIHLITGRYWDAEEGRTPVTRFPADRKVDDVFVNLQPWGDEPGEKMDDFAALGSGTGGFYYNIARGYQLGATGLPYDRPAVYQPPKSGSGYSFEYTGDILPDYTSFCLDCHTHRVSTANPPINWGQPGVSCTDNSVDPPDQRIECGADHGLGAAGMPYYISDSGTAGNWGTSGNPDVLFDMNFVTRGRHNGHFMRWPYDSAERAAGINFVLSCTDCHEAHGSNRGSMIRERFSVNNSGACGSGGSPGQNCTDGGNWNSYCNACHYYYGGHHANMSCGNASCHEANSIHRIIHVVDSGAGTQLMLTAAGYEDDYQRPDFTPDIVTAEGHIGSDELTVTFASGVWSNIDMTLSLEPDDFRLFDANGGETRTITNVVHNAGDSFAVLTLSTPLTADDLDTALIAAEKASVWDWYEGGYVNWATGTLGPEVVSAGPWPAAITGPPPFALSKAIFAGSQIHVIFTEGAYTNIGSYGDLTVSDFTVNCGGRTITGVSHATGDSRATLTLNSALDFSDIGSCTVSASANQIYNAYDTAAPADPAVLAYSDECPTGVASIQLNDSAGSTMAFSDQYWLAGTVNNAGAALPGDGYLHGDGASANYITFEYADSCLQSPSAVTLEARIRPAGISAGTYIRRIFARDSNQNYQMSVWRNTNTNAWPNFATGIPDDTASIAFWVPAYPQPAGEKWWKPVLTDYSACPVRNDHWYQIKAVWNSDKTGGIPGDIFIDDQGTDGNGTGENWAGFINCTDSDQSQLTPDRFIHEGDTMRTGDGNIRVGANVHNGNNQFNGLIDWIEVQTAVDYSGVDDTPNPPQP